MFTRQVDDQLTLRQYEAADAEPLFALVERHRLYLREWLPGVDWVQSLAEIQSFLVRITAQLESGLGPNCAILLSGQMVGNIGCHPFDLTHRCCNLGYWLAAEHQGKGILTRCCRRMVEYLFAEEKLHRVEIRCATANARSCAIPQRLGFQHEGILREAEWVNYRFLDMNVYGMLKQEWK